MAVLTHDCPHCGTRNNGFVLKYAEPNALLDSVWTAFFVCPSCWQGVGASIFSQQRKNPIAFNGDFKSSQSPFVVQFIYPEPKATEVPEHLPPAVSRAFKEGCEILRVSPSGACAQFRRALELGLKDLSPDIEASKLVRRIDRMADEGKLTPAIKEWAHKLRIDGNDAIHEIEETTAKEAMELENLTRFILIYLYSLPERIKQAQAASDQ